jgi:molecular chaperone DnaK
LKDAGCKISDIDDIILVGGQSRMPKVQDKVKEVLRQGAAQGRQSG